MQQYGSADILSTRGIATVAIQQQDGDNLSLLEACILYTGISAKHKLEIAADDLMHTYLSGAAAAGYLELHLIWMDWGRSKGGCCRKRQVIISCIQSFG